mmetsp:Transcript_33018/g.71977  ORF Transcript_33018/g.71977 Transcript_33018/m.71977 type:complete len:205 (-) Transcript_33018:521-1135(-)
MSVHMQVRSAVRAARRYGPSRESGRGTSATTCSSACLWRGVGHIACTQPPALEGSGALWSGVGCAPVLDSSAVEPVQLDAGELAHPPLACIISVLPRHAQAGRLIRLQAASARVAISLSRASGHQHYCTAAGGWAPLGQGAVSTRAQGCMHGNCASTVGGCGGKSGRASGVVGRGLVCGGRLPKREGPAHHLQGSGSTTCDSNA